LQDRNTYVCCDIDRISRELMKEAGMCSLQHANILALHAVICEPYHYGIIMEHMLHGSLDNYVLSNDVRHSVCGWYTHVQLFVILLSLLCNFSFLC